MLTCCVPHLPGVTLRHSPATVCQIKSLGSIYSLTGIHSHKLNLRHPFTCQMSLSGILLPFSARLVMWSKSEEPCGRRQSNCVVAEALRQKAKKRKDHASQKGVRRMERLPN
eukprot:scaffold46669_cov13-Tisochrysis_lutea.AAC.1